MFAITTKLLGWTTAGAGALALAAGAYAGIQTKRLDIARTNITTLQATVSSEKKRADDLTTIANERAAALEARDRLISQQSGSIDALKAASDANRVDYLAGIRAAEGPAKSHETRAAELVRVPVKVPDDRCEAARTLIEEELLNVR